MIRKSAIEDGMEIETQGNFVTSWDYRGALQCFNITDHLGYEYILPRDAAGVGINVRGKCVSMVPTHVT